MSEAYNNVIDFSLRATALRMKHVLSGAEKVSPAEAARAAELGLMHLKGDGVARDAVKAARFLATAAKGGIAQAKHELALLHLDGCSVTYDADYAIALLESASADGYAASMVTLAEACIFGKHCSRDFEKALELLYKVVFDNEPAAMYYLAYIYDKSPEHRNSFEAAYWYRRAAEHGHFKSQIRLASLYATGDGVPHCPETAEAFLGVAMETTTTQDPKFLYWQGAQLEAHPETAFLAEALIKAAADMKYTPAQRLLLARGWRA